MGGISTRGCRECARKERRLSRECVKAGSKAKSFGGVPARGSYERSGHCRCRPRARCKAEYEGARANASKSTALPEMDCTWKKAACSLKINEVNSSRRRFIKWFLIGWRGYLSISPLYFQIWRERKRESSCRHHFFYRNPSPMRKSTHGTCTTLTR